MREDIQYLLVERQRIGSRRRSVKTALRLSPGIDPANDPDTGPSSGWPRIHWNRQKSLNENLRPLYNFLHKSVGRKWNDVYSEIRERIDPRRTIGYHVLQHVEAYIWKDIVFSGTAPYCLRSGTPISGFYVDPRNGILCRHQPKRMPDPPKPVDSIRWREDTSFQLVVVAKQARCGCVMFRDAVPGGNQSYRPTRPNVPVDRQICVHGNQPEARSIWYVIEHRKRNPEEVYRVVRFGDPEARRFGLKEGETRTVYYRDVPEKLKDPVVIRKKVANRKQLATIRALLERKQPRRP